MELVNPTAMEDRTYLWSERRLDYIFMSPGVAHAAVKAGHHLFHQYFISDHKGVYLHCDVQELFDVASIDKSHYSQRILTMQRRDTVEKYINKLEFGFAQIIRYLKLGLICINVQPYQ